MIEGLASTYMVECEQTYRRTVVYPAAARRAQLVHELRQLRPDSPRRTWRSAPARWMDAVRLHLGTRRTAPYRST
jgi:hypothetical protein